MSSNKHCTHQKHFLHGISFSIFFSYYLINREKIRKNDSTYILSYLFAHSDVYGCDDYKMTVYIYHNSHSCPLHTQRKIGNATPFPAWIFQYCLNKMAFFRKKHTMHSCLHHHLILSGALLVYLFYSIYLVRLLMMNLTLPLLRSSFLNS